jgi:hypothetical protein
MALGRRSSHSKAITGRPGYFERGVSAVEWIILLPVVFLLMAGITVFGTRYSDYLFMAQTVHELALVIARVPGMDRVQTGGGPFTLQLVGNQGGVTDTAASACIQCLIDEDMSDGEVGCTGDQDGFTNYQCMSDVVSWYSFQFIRTKNMFFQGEMPLVVSYSGGAVPIPTISVSITAQPVQWLLPDWMPFFDPISVNSFVPYMVLP